MTRKRTATSAPRVWSIAKADKEFSFFIRERDGRCLFPGCTVQEIAQLQCSHYVERRHSSTRYDPDNCIALCWKHHFRDKYVGFEYQKQRMDVHGYDGRYTQFMQKWLGPEKWKLLLQREKTSVKSSSVRIELMIGLGKL